MSKDLLELLGLAGTDVEIIVIRRAATAVKGTTDKVDVLPIYEGRDGSLPGQSTNKEKEITNSVDTRAEVLPIYEDKEGSLPGQSTNKELEVESGMLRSKLKDLRKANALNKAPEFIELDKIDEFLRDIQTTTSSRYHKRKRSDTDVGPSKLQRKEDHVKEPGEITAPMSPKREFCRLCRVPGHTTDNCYNVCYNSECRYNVHFKDNCPLTKPCTVCYSYSHNGYHCNLRCKDSGCKYIRKYHSDNKCGYKRR